MLWPRIVGRHGRVPRDAELVDPQGNLVAHVTAHLRSVRGTFTSLGEWGGELEATAAQPDPFVPLLGIDGLSVQIGGRAGVVRIVSATRGGQIAQVEGIDDRPFGDVD